MRLIDLLSFVFISLSQFLSILLFVSRGIEGPSKQKLSRRHGGCIAHLVLASHSAALGSILGDRKNFSIDVAEIY